MEYMYDTMSEILVEPIKEKLDMENLTPREKTILTLLEDIAEELEYGEAEVTAKQLNITVQPVRCKYVLHTQPCEEEE